MRFITVFGIVWFIVLIAGITGWVMNLVDVVTLVLANPPLSTVGVLVIAKIIGIFFFPLGAILGYF